MGKPVSHLARATVEIAADGQSPDFGADNMIDRT